MTLGWAGMPNEVYFGQYIRVCCIDLLYLMHESTFGHYGSLDHFMLAWIVLFDPPLCMGMAMIKGARKYVGMHFLVHKLAWRISQWRPEK